MSNEVKLNSVFMCYAFMYHAMPYINVSFTLASTDIYALQFWSCME